MPSSQLTLTPEQTETLRWHVSPGTRHAAAARSGAEHPNTRPRLIY